MVTIINSKNIKKWYIELVCLVGTVRKARYQGTSSSTLLISYLLGKALQYALAHQVSFKIYLSFSFLSFKLSN